MYFLPKMHMVSFENFVKSMPPSLSGLKVTPSFCFAFKILDNPTATNHYIIYTLHNRGYIVCMLQEGLVCSAYDNLIEFEQALQARRANFVQKSFSEKFCRNSSDAPETLDKMLMSDMDHQIGLKTQFENEIAFDTSQMFPRCY